MTRISFEVPGLGRRRTQRFSTYGHGCAIPENATKRLPSGRALRSPAGIGGNGARVAARTHAYEAPSGSWLLFAILAGSVFWVWVFYQLGRAFF